MTTNTHIFRITIQKIPIEGKGARIRGFMQRQLMDFLCIHLFNDTDRPFRDWNKAERDDPIKTIEWLGTKSECDAMLSEWENVTHNTINKLKDKIKETRAFKSLGVFKKKQLQDNAKRPIDSFLLFLTINSINFTMEVVQNETFK